MADVRPIVGISMGDPFGNGPEISVKSLADKTLYDRCKPLIVGDKSSMEYALAVARKVSGIDLKLNIVKEPAEGKYEYGTIDLIDLGIVPAEKIPNTLDDPKGPQPFHIGACELGGEAAFHMTLGLPIIRVSVDHGTGFGHAGNGGANELSLVNAVDAALQMASYRKAHQA